MSFKSRKSVIVVTTNQTNNEIYRNNLDEYKWELFFEEFQGETPRAAVIISGAFLDSLLRDLIASFMIEDKKKVDELLGTEDGSEAPLSSFSARIKTSYCLGLITKSEFDDLNQIRKIRNKFAHRMHGYSFESQEIIGWCNALQAPNIIQEVLPDNRTHRDKYILAVSLLAYQLGVRILSIQHDRRKVLRA